MAYLSKTGTILESNAVALVIPVSGCGQVGAGFKDVLEAAYPAAYHAYRQACINHEMTPGRILSYYTGQDAGPHWLLITPIQDTWRQSATYAQIELALAALAETVMLNAIPSVAIPALGCAIGKLSWHIVEPKIEVAFSALVDQVDIELYAPNLRPKATKGRASTAIHGR